VYMWYHMLHDLAGGVDVIIDVCAGTGSASVAALELGHNVISVEKNDKQFEGLTRRLELVHRDLHGEGEDLSDDWEEILEKQRAAEGYGGMSYPSFQKEKEIRDVEKEMARLAKEDKAAGKKVPVVFLCGVCEEKVDDEGSIKCCLCDQRLHVDCSADGDGEKGETTPTCKGRECEKTEEQQAKKAKK
jgi:hypothetical protein